MRPSIRTRLLILTTTVISLVVIAVGMVVWLSMSRSLRRQIDDTLRAQSFVVSGRVENEEGRVQFDLEAIEQIATESFGDSLVQVLDADDKTIYVSPQRWFEKLSPSERPSSIDSDGISFFDGAWSDSQKRLRLIEMRLTVPPSDEPPRENAVPLKARVLVARPIDDVESTLLQLAWTLAAVAGVSLLAALVGGYLIARQGTGPIMQVAKAISQVAPGHPRLDLDLRRVPVELDPMIAKTANLLFRIDQELERQRQLTADVAHDLRTPVAGVRTLLDVCAQRDRNQAEYVETINAARAALRQLSRLLDDVLTLARLDAGAEQPQLRRVRIADVMRDATETVRPTAIARGVRIERDGDSDAEAMSDPSKLVKILTNLLGNAVDHSPAGGAVHIGTSVERDHLVVSVRDSGPGVRPTLRDSIFDRFVRGDAARSRGEGHHGLGLPIARGLARLLGGDVELAVTGGPGAVFRVRLPMRSNGDASKET